MPRAGLHHFGDAGGEAQQQAAALGEEGQGARTGRRSGRDRRAGRWRRRGRQVVQPGFDDRRVGCGSGDEARDLIPRGDQRLDGAQDRSDLGADVGIGLQRGADVGQGLTTGVEVVGVVLDATPKGPEAGAQPLQGLLYARRCIRRQGDVRCPDHVIDVAAGHRGVAEQTAGDVVSEVQQGGAGGGGAGAPLAELAAELRDHSEVELRRHL